MEPNNHTDELAAEREDAEDKWREAGAEIIEAHDDLRAARAGSYDDDGVAAGYAALNAARVRCRKWHKIMRRIRERQRRA